MQKILVVDDEEDLREILQFNLETEGYQVDTAASAEEALGMDLQGYSLFLLDVMMEGMDGFAMARRLKANPATSKIPIIFATALDDEQNIVSGLDLGADDYISKPLSISEVKARVRAIMRRCNPAPSTAKSSETLSYEDMYLHLDSKKCIVCGSEVVLTKMEFELLTLFLKYPDRTFSRQEILQRIWPRDTYVLLRTVDVNITRLRKKIGIYGPHLKTRFGYGYQFES